VNSLRAGSVVILALAGASGCSTSEWVHEDVHPLGPTLQVVNQSSLEYRVTVTPALVVMARPGQTSCVRVGILNDQRTIEVFALASSRPYYAPPENLMSSPGWILEIGQRPTYDVLSLRPAKPCM